MSSRMANKPPSGEPWVWLTRELLASDAWRSQSINTRRFIDFLLLEHMSKGGRENGDLKAPRQQLAAFGIGPHFISEAIRAAETMGLVDCRRGGMRVATTYLLTWLAHRNGTPATDRWRSYRNPELQDLSGSKIKNLSAKQQSGLGAKQHSDGPNLSAKQQSDDPKSLGAKQHYLSRRRSFHGETEQGDAEGECFGVRGDGARRAAIPGPGASAGIGDGSPEII